MKMEACLFDLDGVIVNTAKYHYYAWHELARSLGFEFTEADNERLKGVSRMQSLEILLSIGGIHATQEQKEEYARVKNDRYVEMISKIGKEEILPGVVDFLTLLKENNYKIALGSASKNSMLIMKNIELLPIFDAIVDGNMICSAKPDPQVFLLGAEKLGVTPSRCVVFEDAEAGIEAAINAGMKSVGIGSKDILGKADKVIPDFRGATLGLLNF